MHFINSTESFMITEDVDLDEECDTNEYCYPIFTYALTAIMTLATLLGIMGNTMVILVIMKSPKLHSIIWGLLFNLAISDFFISIVLIPMSIGVLLYRPSTESQEEKSIGCSFTGFLFITLGVVSIWTLTLLSIERFIAVIHPLHYHQKVTKKRVIIALVILWILAVIAGAVPLFTGNGYSYEQQYQMCLPNLHINKALTCLTLCFGVCVPFLVMSAMYISVGRIALTHAQRKVIECNEDHCTYVSPKQKDYRALKVIIILAVVFTTCWLPFTVVTLIGLVSPESVSYIAIQLAVSLTLLNATINPWLYSILNRTFRMAIKTTISHYRMRFIFCVSRENRVNPSKAQNNTTNGVALNNMEDNKENNENGTQEIPIITVREEESSPLPNVLLTKETEPSTYGSAACR